MRFLKIGWRYIVEVILFLVEHLLYNSNTKKNGKN